jgi:inner membrane protein
MPSPIAHALAGVAVAWSAEQLPGSAGLKRPFSLGVTLSCVALAVLPDADLIYMPIHRKATHSIGATILVTILAIAVTGKVTRLSTFRRAQGPPEPARGTMRSGPGRTPSARAHVAWGLVLVCAAAHASHLLLDWLGADPSLPMGIQALWPFSLRWFISGWNLFPYTERRHILSAASIAVNLKAAGWEIAIMGPIVLALGLWRRRGMRSCRNAARTGYT